jgi:putative transposase
MIGARVRASHVGSYRTYGARRVWHDLLAEGISCGLHRVERLMQAHGLRARPRRRGLPKDQGERSVIAGNVLDRQFTADRPNQKWVADFTYIWTAEGWLYVAAVIDLFSRRVVGWSMSDTMTAQLVTDALIMAIWRRGKPDALLHHSDQGSQYTSEQFQRLMADNGVTDPGLSQPYRLRTRSWGSLNELISVSAKPAAGQGSPSLRATATCFTWHVRVRRGGWLSCSRRCSARQR